MGYMPSLSVHMTVPSSLCLSSVPTFPRFTGSEHSDCQKAYERGAWGMRGMVNRHFHPYPRSFKMSDNESVNQQGDDNGITSPDADHPGEATAPPGNPDRDEQAVEESQEKLDQAGGGH